MRHFAHSPASNPLLFLYAKKAAIHQVTSLLATSKHVLFPGHNNLLSTGTDGPTLWLSVRVIIKMKGHQYRWLAGGYDLEMTFLEVASGYLVYSGSFCPMFIHLSHCYYAHLNDVSDYLFIDVCLSHGLSLINLYLSVCQLKPCCFH